MAKDKVGGISNIIPARKICVTIKLLRLLMNNLEHFQVQFSIKVSKFWLAFYTTCKKMLRAGKTADQGYMSTYFWQIINHQKAFQVFAQNGLHQRQTWVSSRLDSREKLEPQSWELIVLSISLNLHLSRLFIVIGKKINYSVPAG